MKLSNQMLNILKQDIFKKSIRTDGDVRVIRGNYFFSAQEAKDISNEFVYKLLATNE